MKVRGYSECCSYRKVKTNYQCPSKRFLTWISFWMPWLTSIFYLTLNMKENSCYGNAKMKQKKVDPSLPLFYWDQTMFGVITVQEFKLRVTQLLSKALCLEEVTMMGQHIQTQEKSALCLKCHMKYKENEFKNSLYFKSCKVHQPIHSEILQCRKNMSAGQFYPEKKK